MNLTGGIVLFASIWWLTLFVVMPIGQRSQADMGEVVAGTHAGAPSSLAWKRKLFITTAVTTAIWGVIAFIILGDYITRADITYLDQLVR